LGTICKVATAGESGKILFWLGKQQTISPFSRCPNFTKFAQNTSIGDEMKTFGTEFCKFFTVSGLSTKYAKIDVKRL